MTIEEAIKVSSTIGRMDGGSGTALIMNKHGRILLLNLEEVESKLSGKGTISLEDTIDTTWEPF